MAAMRILSLNDKSVFSDSYKVDQLMKGFSIDPDNDVAMLRGIRRVLRDATAFYELTAEEEYYMIEQHVYKPATIRMRNVLKLRLEERYVCTRFGLMMPLVL